MERHGGNLLSAAQQSGCQVGELLDFSANINPLGFPEWLRPLISSQIEMIYHYPEPGAATLVQAIAKANELPAEKIIAANGASELLNLLPAVLDCRRAVIPVPSYVDYQQSAELAGLDVVPLPLSEDTEFAIDFVQLDAVLEAGDLVIIGQPNNPTGQITAPESLLELISRHTDVWFVLDESFIDFCQQSYLSLRHNMPKNLIIVQSMTKSWAIPGLRLGYAIANADIIEELKPLLSPWTVNSLAQAVGIRAMEDSDFLVQTRTEVARLRQQLMQCLSAIAGLKVFPGEANFLLIKLEKAGLTGESLSRQMLKQGIMIRRCCNFEGLDDSFIRIAVRTEEENEQLCQAFEQLFGLPKPDGIVRKKPALMFQGTGSNAGKSILTAALCRILQQDGVSVAPFKAQNMSLNSCVTFAGGEMGRAQVLQAQASRLDPDVRMNPVLLKPSSATGSQVILQGKVYETMDFRDYALRREQIFAEVKDCYDSLSSEHQVMVLEGAGSPAEINLKKRDIVNMNMARYADAKVLLVGDIDRGGVFASFVGSMELLSEWERKLVAGFVINRFRGDATLLDEALVKTTAHSGKPFFGVIPYLTKLGLPEEDSVDYKDGRLETLRPAGEVLDIALIDLPHISNFTDFDALRIEDDVHLRKVTSVSELGRPDAIILPGSKNVINDLAYLNETGLAAAIQRLAASQSIEVVGVCGGYQLLGKRIHDPHGIESTGLDCQGLGLLDLETELAPQKTTTSCQARHLLSGQELRGYEIHHGLSTGDAVIPLVERQDGVVLGHANGQNERIWGTYLHGVFDADGFRRWFLDRLRERRGWQPVGEVRAVYDLEPALDRLADHVRNHIDMDRIYRLLNL